MQKIVYSCACTSLAGLGMNLVLIETSPLLLCKLLLICSMINKKAVRFLSKQGHLQPHFHSKTRQLST